jgi:hypothetical protein
VRSFFVVGVVLPGVAVLLCQNPEFPTAKV